MQMSAASGSVGYSEGSSHRNGERLGVREAVAVVADGYRQTVVEVCPPDRVAEARVTQNTSLADHTVGRQPVSAGPHARDGAPADIELIGIGTRCESGAD